MLPILIATATLVPADLSTAVGPGTTALLSAGIAGLVALATVLITHYFTRGRAREEWFRERMYEATSGLVDAYRAILREADTYRGTHTSELKTHSSETNGITGGTSLAELDAAFHAYTTYLSKLDMLLVDRVGRHTVAELRTITRTFRWMLIRDPSREKGTTAADLIKHRRDLRRELAQEHSNFVEYIKRTYFVPRRHYDREARQNRKRT